MLLHLHRPGPPLDRFVELITYFSGYDPGHSKERLLPDGAVEITAQGSARALSHLESRLVEGPPAARVDDVERLPLNPRLVSPGEGFEIVRSQ